MATCESLPAHPLCRVAIDSADTGEPFLTIELASFAVTSIALSFLGLGLGRASSLLVEHHFVKTPILHGWAHPYIQKGQFLEAFVLTDINHQRCRVAYRGVLTDLRLDATGKIELVQLKDAERFTLDMDYGLEDEVPYEPTLPATSVKEPFPHAFGRLSLEGMDFYILGATIKNLGIRRLADESRDVLLEIDRARDGEPTGTPSRKLVKQVSNWLDAVAPLTLWIAFSLLLVYLSITTFYVF
ncbi:MAG: hypothetical protein AAF141_03605 [Pseudomonadota bacterium]